MPSRAPIAHRIGALAALAALGVPLAACSQTPTAPATAALTAVGDVTPGATSSAAATQDAPMDPPTVPPSVATELSEGTATATVTTGSGSGTATTGTGSGTATGTTKPTTKPTTTPTTKPATTPAKPTLLKSGSKGAQVVALQKSLLALGYWVSSTDGTYGWTTSQAVMALQKAAGLSRDGVAGPKTLAALARGVRPTARSRTGTVVELDKERQLIKIVTNGKVTLTFNTSTGSGETYVRETDNTVHVASTPRGKFEVERQVSGWRKAPLGELYYPKYFNGGIAIHGSYSIPGYAASHGCARVSVPAMDYLWSNKLLPIGRAVWVY